MKMTVRGQVKTVKYSVIDIGSNSIRLTVYKVKDKDFSILFKQKKMVGLAGYVDNGRMSRAGISCAAESLLEFKNVLKALNITERIYVFATASLRNIVNTEEAVINIENETGFKVDVITGEQEAFLGYMGVMQELSVSDGVFADIGGASTEIAIFKNKGMFFSRSLCVGSLKLFKDFVEKILPGDRAVKEISAAIDEEFQKNGIVHPTRCRKLICTGGTARSVLRFAKYLRLIDADSRELKAGQLVKVGRLLLGNRKTAADAILKIDPERIHTIIPGYLILRYITKRFNVEELIVSNYGVREGYLCQKILK